MKPPVSPHAAPSLADLLERSGFYEQGEEALKSAAESLGKEAAVSLIKERGHLLWTEIGGAALAHVSGPLVAILFRVIFKKSDDIAGKLDKLIQGPYRAAINEADLILTIGAKSGEEIEFRERRLHHCIDQLGIASALVPAEQSSRSMAFACALAQGVCARQIRGGNAYARVKFAACGRVLQLELDALLQRKADLTAMVGQLQKTSDGFTEILETTADEEMGGVSKHATLGMQLGRIAAEREDIDVAIQSVDVQIERMSATTRLLRSFS